MEAPSSNKGWHEEWLFGTGRELSSLPRLGDGNNSALTVEMRTPAGEEGFALLEASMETVKWDKEELTKD